MVNLSGRAEKVRVALPEPAQGSFNTLIADGAKLESDGGAAVLDLAGFGYMVAKRK